MTGLLQQFRSDAEDGVGLQSEDMNRAVVGLADAQEDVAGGGDAAGSFENAAVAGQRLAGLIGELGVIRITDRNGAAIAWRLVAGMKAYQVSEANAQRAGDGDGGPDVARRPHAHRPAIDGFSAGDERTEGTAAQDCSGR